MKRAASRSTRPSCAGRATRPSPPGTSGAVPAPARARPPRRSVELDLLEATLDELLPAAAAVRDLAHGTRITFSPKVFIPLTELCQDRCGYCTFAKPPARLHAPYLDPEQVLGIAR